MKIFRIRNRRNSLATNSSSTHSVVYKNKEQIFEDLGIFDNRYYDRCTETIAASREAKIRYIFSNIFYCNELVEMLSERYPEMKKYYPLAKDHFEIYCNEEKYNELKMENKEDYWEKWNELESFQFGDHCRGELYNTADLHLSYEYLCNIIDSPDIVIVGGSDERDFVYDTTEGCKEIESTYSHMGKITEKVKNGNYYILYGTVYGRKEKIRLQVDSIPEMIPEYPELVDMKITDACEHKCPFCYMNSTPKGKHANYFDIYQIVNSFKTKTEFALGGGNVLLHPDFEKIVRHISKNNKNHIVNITIRHDDITTINNNPILKNAINKYVNGIGLSVQKSNDVEMAKEFIVEMLDLGKHISLHIIPEMIGFDEVVAILFKMNEINDEYIKRVSTKQEIDYYSDSINKCKILFLGLKQTGRAKKMEQKLLTADELTQLAQISRYRFNVDTAFVNTYNIWFEKVYGGDEELFLTRNEGEYSMFIDAVNNKAYASSYKTDEENGIDIFEESKICDVFAEIRRRNGFQPYVKPVPYYKK